MFCKSCNVAMTHVRRFSKEGHFELNICPKCHTESKKHAIILDKEYEYHKCDKENERQEKGNMVSGKNANIISKKHTTHKKKR